MGTNIFTVWRRSPFNATNEFQSPHILLIYSRIRQREQREGQLPLGVDMSATFPSRFAHSQ